MAPSDIVAPAGATLLSFAGLTLSELTALLASRARAMAAVRWLYGLRKLPSCLPERIPGVTPEAWERLREACELSLPRVLVRKPARDGTVKFAFESRGAAFEAVLIPARGRSTVCVSSQSGCTRRCSFCATAKLGFCRSLDADEIVGQFLIAKNDAPPHAPLRNVVFMGMGEPMDNLDSVFRAIDVLTQAPAPQLGADHMTVSTSGVLPGMKRLLASCPAHLALSLNATTDAQREVLMPQTRQWPIVELLGLLRESSGRTGRLFFIEYVLLDGFNDSDDDARRLVSLLEGVRARVNLIPFNAYEGCPWGPSKPERVAAFRSIVHAAGIRCLVRTARGEGIDAACGQLALKR